MRPLLALLITLGLLGGVYGYVRFADSVRRTAVEIEIDYSQGLYSVEIQSTFECHADPKWKTEAMKVLFKGQTVFESRTAIPADQTTEIQPLDGVESGENEIYVSANMQSPTRGLGAIRVTVKRNGIPVVEQLLTSDPGLTTVGGPVVFQISPAQRSQDDDH